MWSWLRNRRFGDYKFRRQHPVGDYILDFYCAELKMAIELDGEYHDFVFKYDQMRTAYLKRQGIEVLRIANEELINDSDSVSATIQWAINKRK